MVVGVKGGEIVSVHGDEEHPVNEGSLCPKGLSEHLPLKSPNRAHAPLWRGEPISWDRAYEEMVGRVRRVQEQYGKESFAVLSTGQLVTEEFYALGKLVQLGFGTSNFDGNTTLCMSSAVAGYKQSFGSDGPPGSYRGLREADTVFLIGANIADNHPILWHHLNQNEEYTLIVCDPRKTKTAMFADLYLPIRPRGDVYLLNGLINLVIKHGYVDQDFVDTHTTGFEALAEHASHYPIEVVAEHTGLSPESIWAAFQAIAKAENVLFAWTMGVNHSTQGTDTVSLINTLALITGNIGRTGAAPLSITGQCNAMGTREFGFASSLPGYRKFESEADREELAALWGLDAERLPKKRGLAYPDIIDAILAGRIKALWVIATNPLASFPDQERLRQALECGKLSDLVLPTAVWGEKSGSYTNSTARGGQGRFRYFHGFGPGARSERRTLSRMARPGGCVRGDAPNIQGTALRLQRHELRKDGRLGRNPVALQRRASRGR